MRKKLKWNRFCTIFVLLMFITVTYASFNTNLFINGKGYVRVDKEIRITNIRLLEVENNGYENVNSEYSVDSVSMDVSLPKQASSVTYEATISNVSDKRYKITDILESSYNNKNVKYELVDASIGNIVEPHTTKTFKVRFTNNIQIVEEDDVYETKEYTFDFTGSEQVFTVPYDGEYTLEVWGAQGGSSSTKGGYGGYAKGTILLKKNQKIFINVGGSTTNYKGGYNGGGSSLYKDAHGGGGATHIANISGLLSTLENYKGTLKEDSYYDSPHIFIVAGGGGGTSRTENNAGGAGGGIEGNINNPDTCIEEKESPSGSGGTQTIAGNCRSKNWCNIASFGQGGESFWPVGKKYSSTTSTGGGGGGGFYGGGSGVGGDCYGPGGGGSGYIGSSKLTNKAMYCYKCTESSQESTKTISTENHSATPTSNYAKEGNGYAKITVTRKVDDGTEFDFDYTGGEQTFTVPYTGTYKLEVWGAGKSAYGGYSSGLINLSKETLYINVGGQGALCGNNPTKLSGGGYNGGGNCYQGANAGSGATHIATKSGVLSTLENYKDTILIVAGGAGGYDGINTGINSIAGAGGGFKGGNASSSNSISYSFGGTQTAGGSGSTNGSFGQGGNNEFTDDSGGAGGGGYYGGGSSTKGNGSGSGGSGYIGNSRLYEKVMYCYQCEESSEVNTKTFTTQAHSKSPKQFQAKEGNGYSRITLIKRTINQTKLTLDFTFEEYLNGNEYTFGFTGDEQTFTVPKTGYYKVELWGAQGGTDDDSEPGDGAYTSGKIKLNAGEKLYLYVGGQGITGNHNNTAEYMEGGWNGGGYGKQSDFDWTNPTYYSSGGGSTDIRLVNGNWNNTESLNSRIMVAAGGGGFHHDYHSYPDGVHANIYGGAGGGLVGKLPKFMIYITYNPDYASTPATQTQGGIAINAISNTRSETRDGQYGMANQYTTQSVGAGGGGGFYGGAGCGGGTGGSSYISGHNGSVAITSSNDITPRNDSNGNQCTDGTTDITCSLHYSNYKFTDTKMIDGEGYNWTTEVGTEVVGMPTHDGSSTMTGNEGNGFAKITLVEEIPEYAFDYTGDVQEFVAPYNGIYKVELWGASGSKRSDTNTTVAGRGAYTNGLINMNKNEKFYLYVGQNINKSQVASFNGSLSSSNNGGPGGGATDIRLIKGETWSEFSSLKSRIMVAAGGGGDTNNEQYPSASGGGLVGIRTTGESGQCQTPGTQFSGGTENCSSYNPKSNGSFGMGSKTGSTGGSGWFGGAGGFFIYGGGSGGSSYISGHPGCVSLTKTSTENDISFVNDSNGIACNDSNSVGYNSEGYNMNLNCNKHYSGYTFYNTIMIDGDGHNWDENGVGNNVVGMPTHDGRSTMIGNVGNGYAKITLVEKIDTYNIRYNLSGGTLSKKRNTYTTFDDDITLTKPTKEGHTFLGWTGGKNLFDKNKVTPSTSILNRNNLGDTYDSNSSFSTDYINIENMKYISFNGSSNPSSSIYDVWGAFYDENKKAVFGFSTYKTYIDLNPTNIDQYHFRYASPTNGESKIKYVRFGFNNSVLDNLQIEEGKEITKYENYITSPIKNLTIPSRSTGNRTYTAIWRDDSVLCRKATTLHTAPCKNTSGETNKMCTASGYALGETITFGSIPSGTEFVSGNAFDCDVNGDGIYDSSSERFYYVTDLEENSDYAVMIYSNFTIDGIQVNNNTTYDDYFSSSGYNYYGPDTIYKQLPTLEQWPNITLYNSSRQIFAKNGTTSTAGGSLPVFQYDNKTSRIITYNEVTAACNGSASVSKVCEYLLENTSFDRRDLFGNNWGQWTESPNDENSTCNCHIDSHGRAMRCGYDVKNRYMHVKPVIEVPKSKIR